MVVRLYTLPLIFCFGNLVEERKNFILFIKVLNIRHRFDGVSYGVVLMTMFLLVVVKFLGF